MASPESSESGGPPEGVGYRSDPFAFGSATALSQVSFGAGIEVPPAPIASAYEVDFHQSIPATVWTIAHNLGRFPSSVSLFAEDFSEEYFGFTVQHLDQNSLRVSLDIPMAGRALLI